MMYQALWIIGERALEGFCMKRFGERPRFIETIGHCGSATIWKSYKLASDDYYRDCYLIFMPHGKGDFTYSDLQEKRFEDYGKISSYRTTVKL